MQKRQRPRFNVRWKKQRLNELEIRTGKWSYSAYFAAVDICHEWHRLPSEFGLCAPEEDFAVMKAFTQAMVRMRAWDQQLQDEDMERVRRGNGTIPHRRPVMGRGRR